MTATPPLSGIILAGGRATRMEGRDKGLIPLLGQPMIAQALRRLRPQVDDVVINANRHQDEYARFGHPVIGDLNGDYAGPLAGVQAALPHCRHEWALVVACDCPLLPNNLGETLFAALKPGDLLATTHDGERMQPLFLLIHRSLQPKLDAALAAGHFKVEQWCRAQAHVVVPITDADAFLNVNTEAERLALEQRLSDQNL